MKKKKQTIETQYKKLVNLIEDSCELLDHEDYLKLLQKFGKWMDQARVGNGYELHWKMMK